MFRKPTPYSIEPPQLFSPFARRFHVAILLMFGYFAAVSMRTNLGMAIVCMVNTTRDDVSPKANFVPNQTTDWQCRRELHNRSLEAEGYRGTLEWTAQQQATLFSATFWGSLLTILPSGYFSDRLGPKTIFLLAILIYSSVSLLTPLLANLSYYAFFIARLFMGLGEGCVKPSMYSMVARWIPPNELSSVVAISSSGTQIAQVFGALVSSSLCATDFLGGWPSIFYLYGVFGVFWAIAFALATANSPEKAKKISNAECNYIVTATMSVKRINNSNGKKDPLPWRAMATSVPLLANIVTQITLNFCAAFETMYLPTYYKDVLLLDLRNNGIYSSLPFFVFLISKNILAVFSDWLRKKNAISRTNLCKIFQGMASFGSASALLALALFVNCTNHSMALWVMCFYSVTYAGESSGVMTSQISIAPPYAGSLTAITTMFGIAANICSLNFIGAIGTPSEWNLVLVVIAVGNILGGIFFLVFASGEVQPWAQQRQMISVVPDLVPRVIEAEEEKKKSSL